MSVLLDRNTAYKNVKTLLIELYGKANYKPEIAKCSKYNKAEMNEEYNRLLALKNAPMAEVIEVAAPVTEVVPAPFEFQEANFCVGSRNTSAHNSPKLKCKSLKNNSIVKVDMSLVMTFEPLNVSDSQIIEPVADDSDEECGDFVILRDDCDEVRRLAAECGECRHGGGWGAGETSVHREGPADAARRRADRRARPGHRRCRGSR